MHGVGCRCTHAWCLWEYHACYSELVAVHTPTPCPYQEYHACYSKLVDVRNTYVKANLAVTKNGKKLNDPRGEGDGSGHNYSSMF
jgi:hypothetical protein